MISIDIRDHAFASGPTYPRITSFIHGLVWTGSVLDARLVRAVWRQFEAGAELAESVRLGATARLVNRATPAQCQIGLDAVIRGILRIEPTGRISIGDTVYIGDNAILSSMADIAVGNGTLLAHGVQIFDNDTHPVDAGQRVDDFRKKLGYKPAGPIHIGSAPVAIGSRCWIGMSSIVMKGVQIGDDTIVASGSVVVSDLPAGVIAAGNPARVVKTLS